MGPRKGEVGADAEARAPVLQHVYAQGSQVSRRLGVSPEGLPGLRPTHWQYGYNGQVYKLESAKR